MHETISSLQLYLKKVMEENILLISLCSTAALRSSSPQSLAMVSMSSKKFSAEISNKEILGLAPLLVLPPPPPPPSSSFAVVAKSSTTRSLSLFAFVFFFFFFYLIYIF